MSMDLGFFYDNVEATAQLVQRRKTKISYRQSKNQLVKYRKKSPSVSKLPLPHYRSCNINLTDISMIPPTAGNFVENLFKKMLRSLTHSSGYLLNNDSSLKPYTILIKGLLFV